MELLPPFVRVEDIESHEGRSFPSWVVFDNYIRRKDSASFRDGDGEAPSARSIASNGDPVLASFRLVAPPGASRLYLHYPREAEEFGGWAALVAAHLDSVLFRVIAPSAPISTAYPWCCHADYFVCTAGGPSGLSLAGPLPPCYLDGRRMAGPGHAERSHMLESRDIGLLRRGEDDFAVADLQVLIPADNDSVPVEAELFRYRSNAGGSGQWEAKRILIRRREGTGRGLRWWATDKVVAFEGCLCWIDYYRGILFCDALDEDPVLRYVELPVAPPEGNQDHPEFGRSHPFVTRSVCVTDGGGAMKFVNVARADGKMASRRRPGSGFTIIAWSLVTPLNSERLGWAMDGAVESDNLWMHDSYAKLRLPLLSPEFPFLSLREPDVVYAVLSERHCDDGKTWMLVIDMRRRVLRSAIPYNEVEDFDLAEDDEDVEMASFNISNNSPLLPSLFSMYLNTRT